MQGRGKDVTDQPGGASSTMTDIAAGDTSGTAGAIPAMSLEARQHVGDGGGGATPSGIAPETPNQGHDNGDPEIRLDEAAQALIGHHLKAVYSEIVQQPVPEEFLKLLDELERKERS